jgi:hypothetical protein
MNEISEQLQARLGSALPGSSVYWEKEPTGSGLDGAVLSAEYQNRKFTMQFEKAAESATASENENENENESASASASASAKENTDAQEDSLIEQIVDDFIEFFSRTIYPKEKFTRII